MFFPQYTNKAVGAVIKRLGSNEHDGLTGGEAEKRLALHGVNEICSNELNVTSITFRSCENNLARPESAGASKAAS